MRRHAGVILLLLASSASAEALGATSSAYRQARPIADVDGAADFSTYDASHKTLYVAREDRVTAIDTVTGLVTSKLAEAHRAHAIIALADGILITESDTNKIIFRTLTGGLVATIDGGDKPDAAVLEPKSGLVVVMNHKSGDITLVDPISKTKVGSVMIGGTLEMAASDGGGLVYVNVQDRNEIAVVDVAKQAIVRRMPLSLCHQPSGLAFAPDLGILMAVCDNDIAVIVDPVRGERPTSFAIGTGADDVMYDQARRRFLVPSGESGTLTIIDADRTGLHVAGNIPTRTGARSGTIDPATGDVYLPSVAFNGKSADGRRAPVPGSFKVLVLKPSDRR